MLAEFYFAFDDDDELGRWLLLPFGRTFSSVQFESVRPDVQLKSPSLAQLHPGAVLQLFQLPPHKLVIRVSVSSPAL